jgi:predicted dehydrogenase
MPELRVGIAGYGVVGKRRRLCIDNHPDLKTVAVCDKVFDKGSSLREDILHFSDYKHLLEEKLDVLFVCMTNNMAAEVTIAGMNKGLHVFCEKPPGLNVEDIERVLECEKTHPSLKLMYGFNHRYHESVQEALKLVHSGELGRVINLRGVYGKSKLITFDQTDWRTRRKMAGGGILLDQGIHMVDLMRLFGGEFEEIHSFVSDGFWGYDVEDNAYALMRTSEGVVGMLHSSATQWRHCFQLEIGMEHGSILLEGILTGSKSYGAETLTVAYSKPETDNGDPKEKTTRYNNDSSWDEEISLFAETVCNNRPVVSGSSAEALKTMQLVFKIYHADFGWREKHQIPNPERNNEQP